MNVLVTGMHRSGTSAVAGALAKAGLAVGEATDLLAPAASNPKGFFERWDVVEFNDRLLDALGWRWDCPPPAPQSFAPAQPDLIAEGRALMTTALDPMGPWLVKDPRISVLLPWWRQILLERMVTVVVVRSPSEVAASLALRDGFPTALGLALWSAYHRHLAAGLTDLPVVVVRARDVLLDAPNRMPDLLSMLEQLGAPIDLSRSDAAISSVEPDLLRGATSDLTTLRWAEDVDQIATHWLEELPGAHPRFRAETHPFAPWEDGILELQRARRDAEARTGSPVEHDDPSAEHDDPSAEHDDPSAEHDDPSAEHTSSKEAESTRLDLEHEILKLRDEVIGLEAEAGTARAHYRWTERELAKSREEVHALRVALKDTDWAMRHRDELLGTMTWRVGRLVLTPVRVIKRLLGRPV